MTPDEPVGGPELSQRALLVRLASAAGTVLASWASRRFSDQLWLPVFLGFLAGLAILGIPCLVYVWLRKRVPTLARAAIALALVPLLALTFSEINQKNLSLNDDAEGPSRLASRLMALQGQSIWDTQWNTVHINGRPAGGDMGRARDVHVIVPFVWTKRDIRERAYIGEAYFVAHYDNRIDADSLIRELELRDYSIAPLQDVSTYFLGWAEEPYVMTAEVAQFKAALRDRLEPPRGGH